MKSNSLLLSAVWLLRKHRRFGAPRTNSISPERGKGIGQKAIMPPHEYRSFVFETLASELRLKKNVLPSLKVRVVLFKKTRTIYPVPR
jgi:hypothetical protein